MKLKQTRNWNNTIKIRYVLLCCFILLLQTACDRDTSPYHELVKHEYYGYAIPEDTLSEQGWTLRTPIREKGRDWDSQCFGGVSAPDTPLDIVYHDSEEIVHFTIDISKHGKSWNHNRATESIQLETEWSSENSGLVYEGDPFSTILFEDIFGNKVLIFGSDLTVEEKIELINQFQYVGTPIEEMINPWSYEWCEENQSSWRW